MTRDSTGHKGSDKSKYDYATGGGPGGGGGCVGM